MIIGAAKLVDTVLQECSVRQAYQLALETVTDSSPLDGWVLQQHTNHLGEVRLSRSIETTEPKSRL